MTGAAGGRVRRGFTLWELVVVMVVLAITLGVAVPAYVRFGATAAATPIDELLDLLREARATAVRLQATVALVVDPKSGAFRLDTITAAGAGIVRADTLSIDARRSIATDSARLRYLFRPTGAAFGDTFRVRGVDGERVVAVDAWNGMPRAHAP
jgi:prepilin-type N-terminal cleavage/methylation domain-containing protein